MHKTIGTPQCTLIQPWVSVGLEHVAALRVEDEDNALRKHYEIKHQGIGAEFSMTVLKMQRTLLVRQVNDSVRITISKAEHILNRQSEWHQAPLVRIVSMSPGRPGSWQRKPPAGWVEE